MNKFSKFGTTARQATALIASVSFLVASLTLATPVQAEKRKKTTASSGLVRDAEIEGLMRQFTRPIFTVAGINPDSVRVYLIANDSINAFVAGGQRIFVNTGIFTKTSSPSEVIGVLAHESGHIAGGHLAKLSSEMARASTERIIGMLIGTAAVIGGAASGSSAAAGAAQGVLMGSQSIAQRNFLSYQRSMEASADQAALKYLLATKQNPKGMLSLFQKLANDSLASTVNADPYLFSHPMPLDRIRNLEVEAKKSPYFGKPDDPGLKLRYDLAKAKLTGFMQSPQRVFQRYPASDNSIAARYARAISMFRRGDIRNAIPVIRSLTDELPQNPYFWELEAQAYMENAQAENGLPAIQKAREILPNNGLLQLLHADILIRTEKKEKASEALKLLSLAKKSEGDMPAIYQSMARAYGLKGDVAHAELATAEFAWLTGDRELAIAKAKAVSGHFKRGTPEWLRANDLLTLDSNAKNK